MIEHSKHCKEFLLIALAACGVLVGAAAAQAWTVYPLLWNKLGSDAEVINSEIGPGGIIIGDIGYSPGQFDDGFQPEPRTGDHNISDNYVRFDNLNLGQEGTIEFWFQPDWISGGHIRHILNYVGEGSSGSYYISFHYNDWQNRLGLGFYSHAGNESVARKLVPSSTPEWSTTEPFHVAIAWNGAAADPADKLKLFLNGVERGALSAQGSPTFSDWSADARLLLATRWADGDWNRHNWEGSDGIIDNIKIWDYAKTDFADRFVEDIETDDPSIDIKPGSDPNSINPFGRGLIAVAILGSETSDVNEVDVTTLAFGPDGASPAHDLTDPVMYGSHLVDVDEDGFTDLVSHYRIQETGIAMGDTEGCLTGETVDAIPFVGCDSIRTEPSGHGRCGASFELILLVAPMLGLYRWRRRL
jgi:hypothetical protein